MSANVITIAEGSDKKSVAMFFCPGCKEHHGVWVNGASNPINGAAWQWNQSLEKPTFQPSVLVRGIRSDMDAKTLEEYRKLPEESRRRSAMDDPRFGMRCHSYVTDGRIQFLGDCTHALAGQTVPLEPHE